MTFRTRCKRGVILFVFSIFVLPASFAQSPAASGKASAAEAAPEYVSPSGLRMRTLKEGTGARPDYNDEVQVHYRGTLADGTEFDSSYARGQPASFQLDQVIKCWTEGLQRMRIGGHAVLVCPPVIAYGSRGSGGSVPPNATLTFEVELLGIFGR